MKQGSFLIGLILSAALAALATAASAEDTRRTISVTGEGSVEAAPDMATIRLGVTNQDTEARAAMDATSDAVAAILARLDELGLERRDMQTQRLTLNPVWSQRPDGEGRRVNEITGFSASNIVMVRVRALEDLGRILDAVIADGANEFNGLRFDVQQPGPLVEKARRAAVRDATVKAQTLAEAAGVPLGPVLSISEHGGRPQPVMMEMAAARGADMPVASGEVSVQAQVSMVFAIGE